MVLVEDEKAKPKLFFQNQLLRACMTIGAAAILVVVVLFG